MSFIGVAILSMGTAWWSRSIYCRELGDFHFYFVAGP